VRRLSNPEAGLLNDLGVALLTAGEASEAAKALQEALRLRPLFLQASFNLGLALEALGDRKAAAAQWVEYLAADSRGRWATVAHDHLTQIWGPQSPPQ
jgi:Flp pilus assembly protein TadD